MPPAEPQIADTQSHENLNYLTITEGIPYNVTCRANGGKPAADITWYVNSVARTEQTTQTVIEEEGVKTKDSIG